MSHKFTIALVCGGPSQERGVSLNSARSVLDHLQSSAIEIIPIYFNQKKEAYELSPYQLYSNTPSDFDFKLAQSGTILAPKKLIKRLKSADIVFPVMHGPFGEDGEFQKLLEAYNIPFVGSGKDACERAFDKSIAQRFLSEKGFFVLPSLVITNASSLPLIQKFFKDYKLTEGVIKPSRGGSSIGVSIVSSPKEAQKAFLKILSDKLDTQAILEPRAKGKEFTVTVIENTKGEPTALIPTEIEILGSDTLFDYRKKYLPTNTTIHHSPPRFPKAVTNRIQKGAQEIFSLFNMKDMTRIDGWVLSSGEIWFSDINPFNGMEQNSFMFQQGARVGFSHRDMLEHIFKQACKRYRIEFPTRSTKNNQKRKEVSVLFGGGTSERQVSVMSGTNVWLKLRDSKLYNPRPYLLAQDNKTVWEVPYTFALHHTVEEIEWLVSHAKKDKEAVVLFIQQVRDRLGISPHSYSGDFFTPKKMSLQGFLKNSPFVFLGLHGGDGESGVMQKHLEAYNVSFNGSGSLASALCMDKYQTHRVLEQAGIPGVSFARQMLVPIAELLRLQEKKRWELVTQELKAKSLIVKPRGDGCSSGIVRLSSAKDLAMYLRLIHDKKKMIPAGMFFGQSGIVEMPTEKPFELLFEEFIETDKLVSRGSQLLHIKKNGWVEVTVGLFEKAKRKLYALNPSITIASGEVLSVEEKFQGGTGVNITPPPRSLMSASALRRTRHLVEKVAHVLDIRGYARIDVFVQLKTGDIKVIEANTLPGLTPSTVIYHQALAEDPAISPRTFLELLIKNKGY